MDCYRDADHRSVSVRLVLIGERKRKRVRQHSFFYGKIVRSGMQKGLHFLRQAEDSAGPVYAFFPGDGHFFRIKLQKIKQNFVFLTESMIELDREKRFFQEGDIFSRREDKP